MALSKEQLRIQLEYNEALKFSSSMQNAINKDLSKAADYRTKQGKKMKDHIESLKKEVSSIHSSADAYEKQIQLENENIKLAKTHFGANKAIGNEKIKANKIAIEGLALEANRLATIEKVNDAAQDMAQSLGGAFDGFVQGASEIPVIGGLLGGIGNMASKMFKQELSMAAMKFTTRFATGLRSGMGTMQALRAASVGLGSSLMSILLGPIGLVLLLVAAIGAGVMAFMKIEKAAKAFRNETGLLNSQTQQTEKNINNVYQSTVGLGASMEDVAQAAADFTNEFGGIEQPMESTLQSMVT